MARTASRRLQLAILTLAGLALAPAAHAGIIFDDTVATGGGITVPGQPLLANEVTATPGTSRTVTDLFIGLTSQNIPETASIQGFLYANDAAGGAPGTLLWTGAVINNVAVNSQNLLIDLSVPSVVVPDTFTFAASITNATGVLGYVPVSGSTAGSFIQAYTGSPGRFSSLTAPYQIEARVVTASAAVPEPSSLALSALGLVATSLVARRRMSRKREG